MLKTIASSTFHGRFEYYSELHETADFNLTLRENADEFSTEYWLDIEWPDYLYQATFTDKDKALRAYLSECESVLDRI